MSGTKILWGQLLVASIVVLAFLWTATEWTAWRLAFQPQLGPPWFTIGRLPIYQPLVFFIWWFEFDAYAPRIFIQGGCIAASGGIAAMVVAIAFFGLAGERSSACNNLWLGALGRCAGGSACRASGTRWRRARPLRRPISAAQWPRARALLCSDPLRQRRRPRHSDIADVAAFHDRPRHQGREF
jgi:hypothetical protein